MGTIFILTSDCLLALKFLTQGLLWCSRTLCIQTFCWLSALELLNPLVPQFLALPLLRHLSAFLHLQVSMVKVKRVIGSIVNPPPVSYLYFLLAMKVSGGPNHPPV